MRPSYAQSALAKRCLLRHESSGAVVAPPTDDSGSAYDADGAVAFEVRDGFCSWNAGRWRLGVEGGRGRLTRTDASADLALDVSALGATYLGGATFAQLARAGQVDELTPGGLARAGRLFRGDVAPWCADGF